ncbi:MAG TPA: hypothetical protein VHC68_02310 [Candidatus Paceibacterota bacterium]|nr:hypothetical protein [Candidatus Paceibacterota bacterium]
MEFLPFYDKLEDSVKHARDVSGFRLPGWPLFIAGAVALFVAFVLYPPAIVGALNIALFLSPLWLPLLVILAAWHLWLIMRRGEFIDKQETLLLEIRLPRNFEKTPLSMETVLAGIHHTKGESNWYQKYWLGQVRPYWSLEIASIEGKVHFFIWTRAAFRKLVESAFYAQYPGVQLVEVDDYTRMLSATPEEWGVWGCDFKHTQPDPYPIKTYVEYGLDKVQKEHEQIDPLANVIEFLGSMGKGENFWVQIIIRIHAGEKYGKTKEDGKPYTWRDEAKKLVDKIRQDTRQPYTDPASGEERPGFPSPTKGQSDTIAAIERNTSKLAFDVGIRGVYVCEKDKFDGINITGMIGLWKPFNSEGWNGIKATHFGIDYADYPWEFGNEHRKDHMRRHVVEAYRRRQYFHDPFKMPDPMVMSTEEVATIFHIPSQAVESPSLPRIQSATGEAPANLPV